MGVFRVLCGATIVLALCAGCGDGGQAPGEPAPSNNDPPPANNAPIDGPDSDDDGLPDFVEDKNTNGVFDEGTTETDFNNPDTDGDGLLDGDEDKNKNGVVDQGETDPRLADTDGDGLDDSAEINGGTDPTLADSDDDGLTDGQEQTAGTDPNIADSDGDGVLDGDEDRNGDGVLDPGETSPLMRDTDGDGTPDGEENTALACARASRTAVDRPEQQLGDWSFTLRSSFDTAVLDFDAPAQTRLRGAAFSDGAAGIEGFLISRAPTSQSITDAQSQLIVDTENLEALSSIRNFTARLDTTWDGFEAVVVRAEIELDTPKSASEARATVVAALAGVDEAAIDGLPGPAGPTGTHFLVYWATVYRSPGRIVSFGGLAESSQASGDETTVFRLRDLGDGTALGQFGDDTAPGCDPLTPAVDSFEVDLLWVVDRSLSMSEDKEAVAAAADSFYATIANTDLDFRMGVTSADNRQNLWTIEETGFNNDPDLFRDAMLDPPGRNSEFGLSTGLNIARYASGNVLDSHQNFRRDAARIVVFFSDEEDFDIKNAVRDTPECDDTTTPPLAGCGTLDTFIAGYRDFDITTFAITGDPPNGCQSQNGPGLAEEAGHGYIQTALATGGSFGSICADDLTGTFEEIIQASYGVASDYQLSQAAISTTIKVVVSGNNVPRSRQNGFDYDPVNRTILFFGSQRPNIGDEIAVSYEAWQDLTPDPDPMDPIID